MNKRRRDWADHWTRRAKAEGWRSRAAFKLAELDRRHRLLARGGRVADLGAAPGGWSQYAARRVSPGGRVVAVDLQVIRPIAGVRIVQGDISRKAVREALREALGGPADAVISDLAPRLSGNRDFDQARSMDLAAMAMEAALDLLRPGGAFVAKLFQGAGFEEFVRDARGKLAKARLRSPQASRKASRETYLVGYMRVQDDSLT